MTGPRVVFLPDYGPTVGGGHVMRGLTLAQALFERGARCAFAVSEQTGPLIDRYGLPGVESWPEHDWPETPDVAVVDNYALTAEDERRLRPLKVVALDDIGRAHDCDLVVDPGLGRTPADYPGCRALAGPAYALVRPEFTTTRPSPEDGRLLVSLGLTDVGGITASVVARLMQVGRWSAADVVLGAAAKSLEFVREVAAHDPRVTLHVDTREMSKITARASLAVGAGGSSVWERACMRLPSLLLVLADNQAQMAQRLQDAGAAAILDVRLPEFGERFEAELARLLGDKPLRDRIGEASHRLCDGRGAQRVADAILALLAESGAPSS